VPSEGYGAVLADSVDDHAWLDARRIFHAAPDAVVVIDPDGRVCWGNAAAARLLSGPDGETPRPHIGEQPALAEAIGRACATGAVVGLEGLGWTVDGDHRWLDGYVAPVDRTDATVVVLRDVSDRHRAMQTQDLALKAIGHDLRTPLAVVDGMLQLLQHPATGLSAEDILRRVRRNVSRLGLLATNLLELATLEHGARPSEPTETWPGVLAIDAIADLGLPVARIDVAIDPHLSVVVDEPKLQRILANLLLNAVQHTGSDTRIVVRGRVTGGSLELVVEDDGPGLPDGLAERLAAPTGPAPARSWLATSGAGVGLHLAAAFARMLGGHLRASDRPGGGARFTLTVPEGARSYQRARRSSGSGQEGPAPEGRRHDAAGRPGSVADTSGPGWA
jgi:signal transduction histidine kinase